MRWLIPFLSFMPCLFIAIDPNDDRIRAFLKAFERANERCGFRRKQMASYQMVTEAQLSEQMALSRNQHPSAARWGLAPNEVYREFAVELCDLSGDARVVTDTKLDRLIHTVEMMEMRAEWPEERKRRA